MNFETNYPNLDLKEFVKNAFGGYNKLPENWHHEVFYDILQDVLVQGKDGKLYLQDKSKVKKRNKLIIMEAPRFHAKSQSITVQYPISELYRDNTKRIMIVSANQEIAASFVRQIMNNLENNQDLIDNYGSLQPAPGDEQKWGEKAFIIERDSMDKDPSVAGIGIGGKIISKRADIIILDDIIDMDSARTPSMRKKTLEWFENVLLPVLEDDGKIIVVGTAWYKDDLYDYLMNHPAFDIQIKLKALVYHPKYIRTDGKGVRYLPYRLHDFPQALDAGTLFSDEVMKKYKLYERLKGGVLWESKWDFKKLMARKETMSSGAFMRQYLNEPTSEEERVFSDKTIKEITDGGSQKNLLKSWDNSVDAQSNKYGYGNLVIAVGVDLAISKKSSADNSAIAVWGLDDRRRRILLWLEYGKWSPDEIKQRVLEVNENFKPVKIVVENVAYQDMLRQDLANDDLPVEGFRTTGSKKFNEESGIAQIAMLMEQKKVVIPTGVKNSKGYEKVKQLVYEMATYSYDQHAGDVLMASWFAFTALSDFDKRMKDNRGFFSTPALVEHIKSRRAPNKILLLGTNPPVYRYARTSLVSIFREVQDQNSEYYKNMFFEPDEQFMIFVTRSERSVAYIIQKATSEIVGKIEGNSISTLMLVTLLEKAGQFFNNAQIVVDKNDGGDAILLELQKRQYDGLMVFQPDKDGGLDYSEGFKISSRTLPLALDHFKYLVDSVHIAIPDEKLLKEMSDLIGIDGDKLVMGYGEGQRIKTVATALWLLDYYENDAKSVYNGSKKKKVKKTLKVPYRVFN